ncbi:hypothetical protein ESY86_13620 [Subsaximicrobium wynnwilliamsii]|uniref:Uncharacterized protein n=1 Tax=Subsaximicrobium wynnwilliamsii TaxID=291179 RepID=A0A5C6ZI45_9FLAO|nr:hypothetical protein [Subsaximicrobium wynnwilliamsii]TXD83224.1 hypothetical protein ESY87_11015 [Subsaximicrobium wynnwilliamsii]TXD88336.1 hypothetical protein ESY86_13620 [Subsaximicrobium wynnwilliamsii]TXE03057.1 hypothetical protein ESY88_10035 [Subsaximicrobium wynnwilliamsii]
MKNYILTLIIGITLIGCSSDNETEPVQSSCNFINFKYYNGTQDLLGVMSNEYILIAVDTTYNESEIQNFITTIDVIDQNYNYTIQTSGQYKFKEIPLKLNTSKDCEEITQIISDLNQNTIISYVHFAMNTDDCNNLIWEPMGDLCINSYGSSFFVKVFDENDLTDLNQMIIETNTEMVEQNQFMEKWFELRATKESNGDGLAMANFFYESGLFEHSEAGISKYPVE